MRKIYASSVCLIYLMTTQTVLNEKESNFDDINHYSNETIYRLYKVGLDKGIINAEKYTFESFEYDERNVYKDLYNEFNSYNETEPMTYEDWLILNNYGILADTQEPLFGGRVVARKVGSDNKMKFVNTVKKGDILIIGKGRGMIGHAAIMKTDYYILEMPGGRGFLGGLDDNNRQVDKFKWFDLRAKDWISVYRCPNTKVANDAAVWANKNYWNPTGGTEKTLHIRYKIDFNIRRTDPSYCSKLVIQAYYLGTGHKRVTRNLDGARVVLPSAIPKYFLPPFTLKSKGKF